MSSPPDFSRQEEGSEGYGFAEVSRKQTGLAVFVTNRGTAMLLLPSMSLTHTPLHAPVFLCFSRSLWVDDCDICSVE